MGAYRREDAACSLSQDGLEEQEELRRQGNSEGQPHRESRCDRRYSRPGVSAGAVTFPGRHSTSEVPTHQRRRVRPQVMAFRIRGGERRGAGLSPLGRPAVEVAEPDLAADAQM